MAIAGVLRPLRSRLAWRELRKLQDKLVTVGMLPAEEREAAFAALGRSPLLLRVLLGDLNGSGTIGSCTKYSRLDAAADLRLDLLVATVAAREYRERRGRWPSSVASMESDGLLGPEEARRIRRLVLSEEREGNVFQLTLPLPQADTGTLTDAVVRISNTRIGNVR